MALMQVLTEGNLPRLGPSTAPVTMVVFSDFECPYCRKLVDILQQTILPAEGKQVQVVYRFFPLRNHPWALTAAEEAGCAAMQGNDEFWALHNKIFESQRTINRDNAESRILELARSVPGMNFTAFHSCVEKQASLKNVLRDVSLGNMASIYATPTLFVNGWRLDGVANADELKEVIAYASQDSHLDAAAPESGAKSGASK
ncbi:MAG: DsbA family protein [Terriglobia bacterium]